jgi:hypothetical protein
MNNRSVTNYFVDVGLALTFLIVAITGVFKMPILFKLGIVNYKNFNMKIINQFHDFAGIIMTILVIIHIILHWKWIVVMSRKIFIRKK